MPDLEHFANPVVHPSTRKTIDKYKELMKDPVMREIWTTTLGKKLGGPTQGDNKMGAAGTNTNFFLDHEGIKLIPP